MSGRTYYPVQGPACPDNSAHGPLYEIGGDYVCIHVAHVQTTPPGPYMFSRKVVEEAQAKRLGIKR